MRRTAIRLYAERSADSVTINDICAAADGSPRTFFNYFETRTTPSWTGTRIEPVEHWPIGSPPVQPRSIHCRRFTGRSQGAFAACRSAQPGGSTRYQCAEISG
ncbi:TetR/AcrR family transcriptional regulator [Nocardia anaemiae]|uniref:TetR/AcrR family transcriptional regulator n=1 Tax=Nocardia anaemiae TaxID=263910 RepID=UPI001C3FB3A6